MTHSADLQTDTLLLIVVGAHLRAELDDRPMAYWLRDCMNDWQRQAMAQQPGASAGLHTMVCTDVWYLNNQELLARPAVAIGEPGVNAATAYLCHRLPTAFVVDDTLRLHLDTEFIDVQACLWGVNPQATASAVDLFIERYLADFLRHAADS